ncbi:hypothetical protein G9A89_001315 [Geosiphon pyriformis]|nr:hypothetical protein G9A89_001315 [Geosiphon pyriformis]
MFPKFSTHSSFLKHLVYKASILQYRINVTQRANIHYLRELPYNPEKGLAPLFSPTALKILYEEYQARLIIRLNSLTTATIFEEASIIDIIERTSKEPSQSVVFNYASQAFNNDFFLQALLEDPKDTNYRSLQRIEKTFGSMKQFQDLFKDHAMGIFGSGWTWLVQSEYTRLHIINSYNAGTALDTTRTQEYEPNYETSSFFTSRTQNFKREISDSHSTQKKRILAPSAIPSAPPPNLGHFTPLLVLNVWEHAYLTDYGVNGKEKYIDNFWKCVDWDMVDRRGGEYY